MPPIRSTPAPLRLAIAISLLSAAQPASARLHDEQLWLQANTNVPLANRLRVTLEQIARFGDRPDGLYQSELGALFGYRISKQIELGVGYRYVGAHNGNTAADENRFRQQLIGTFGPIATRFRIDERIHPDGDEIGFRIRPMVRYNHRIGTHGWATFVSHESFILPNSTSWGQRRGYDRMRNVIGVTVPIARTATADVGYLNQYRLARNGSPGQMDHALSVQLTINIVHHVTPPLDD